jgi:hypothetical protein
MMHMPSYFWDNLNFCPKPNFPMPKVDWRSVKIQPAPGVVLPPDVAVSTDGTLLAASAPGAAPASVDVGVPSSTASAATDPTTQY